MGCNRTFINKLLNFVGLGLVLYGVAKLYEWMSSDSIIKHTIKCKYCRKRISEKVSETWRLPFLVENKCSEEAEEGKLYAWIMLTFE